MSGQGGDSIPIDREVVIPDREACVIDLDDN